MKTMPTAFLVTSLAASPLVEEADSWGWSVECAIGGDIIFITPTGEVVRATKSASRASRLRVGTKVYLGPAHEACEGIQDLVVKASWGAFEMRMQPPPRPKLVT